MECRICLVEYDHFKHRPTVLIPCSHTICITCMNKLKETMCPICKQKFSSKNTNWNLLDLIPESDYDSARTNLSQLISESIEIYNKLDNKHTNYLLEIEEKLKLIKVEIINKSNEFIELINKRQKELFNEINLIETQFKSDQTSLLPIVQSLKEEIKFVKSNLDDYNLNSEKLNQLSNRLKYVNSQLINRLDEPLSKFNYEYKFVSSELNFNLGNIINLKDETISMHIKNAQNYEKSNLLELALNSYSEAINLNPRNHDLYYCKARLLKDMKRNGEAIYFLNKFIHFEPNHLEANNLSNILQGIELKHIKESITFFNKVIHSDPFNYEAHFWKGFKLLQNKNYKEAIKSFKKTIEINDLKFDSTYYYACCLFYKSDYTNALIYINKSIKINPNYSYSYKMKANILKKLGANFEAINMYKKSIQMKPELDSFISLGNTYILVKKFNKAIEIFDQAIKKFNSESECYCGKADALVQIKNYEEAVKNYDLAINYKSELNYHIKKGHALICLKRLDEAIECFYKDKTSKFFNFIGKIEFIFNGKYSESIMYFNKAIELNGILKQKKNPFYY